MQHDIESVIERFGGRAALAKALDITPANISQWRAMRRIPPAKAIEIERLTGGDIRAVDLVGVRQ